MAKNYCTFVPSKGANLFRELKKQFGYQTARGVFLRAINPNFVNDFKGTLTLDSEGVPTFDSIMSNSFMQGFIGDSRMIETLSKQFSPVEDTIENYGNILESAYQFNTSGTNRDNFIATIEYTDDNQLIVKVQKKTPDLVEKFNNQYSSHRLNARLADIFSPIGITIGSLTSAEVDAGRVGVTDFSKARNIATGFSSMIRVANNMEGAQAISEEFSHLLVGTFRNEPLVSRSIRALQLNTEAMRSVLGDRYEDTVNFYNGDLSLVAEEAVGTILQKNLLNEETIDSTETPSLFRRLINYIVNKFKRFNLNEVDKAILDADGAMSNLAKNILNGTTKVTQEDVRNSEREVQFNALSDRIDRNIKILQDAAKTETKRYKVTKGIKKGIAEQTVENILQYTQRDADTVEGLFNYSRQALSELRVLDAQFAGINNMTPEQKFGFLRSARMYTQSYGSFIKELNDAILDEENESDNLFLRDFEVDGQQVSIGSVLNELNGMSEQLTRRYAKVAGPAFAEFLKPFLGENITIPFGERAGQQITVEALLQEAGSDISFMDRWLDSMADSADTLLQLFDAAVKSARDKARLETIDNIKAIQRLMQKAESYGITDFEWMFEKDSDGHKSGNYISEVNHAQFQKDLKEFEDYLTEKYGVNPTGSAVQEKLAERNQWYQTHAFGLFGSPMPDPTVYRSEAYDNLSDNQKEILQEFLSMKAYYDSKLPKNRVAGLKAVQVRRESGQRILDIMSSPSSIFDSVKESVSSTFLEREDDDQIFGENRAKKGLTDFAGNEFMTLPVLYTNRLKDADEINTDVFGSLMQYAYMANNYQQMDKIIDPLEVGRTLVTDNRRVRETRGGNPIIEKFDSLGVTVANKVFKNQGTYIEQKLNDFFESQIYGRYLKDEGTFNVLGQKVNVNKLTSFILKGSSLAQLGFNWLANFANVTTGIGMQNIEAASGEYFNVKELASADAAYVSEMKDFGMEICNRVKTSKLALFDELFNVKQTYNTQIKHTQNKNWFKRIFGEGIAFLGQEAGDHWLYNRTAIAMAKRKQVLLNGEQMSLWDALQVKDKFADSDIKELNYRSIQELDGSPLNVAKFSREIAHVNQGLFGIYNDEDANAANRIAMGRLLLQYRKWIKPQMNKRFQKGQYNLATGKYEEGYYRTMLRLANELIRGKVQLAAQWDNMTEHERANIVRCITELAQFFLIWGLANWFEWPDDKDRPWAIKMAEYSTKRLAHELGGLTPSTVMLQEQLKTVKQPIPAISVVQNSLNLVNSLIDPTDWVDETASGPYKGLSTLEKNFIKAPIPGVAQYRQIDKFIGDLDTSINYYARPN